jgi:hypothetical protein
VLRSVLLGFVIGISALCKQTFFPFILFIPFFLGIIKNKKIKYSFITYVFISATIVVLPWTVRNWMLTHKVIPVHARAGTVIFKGDLMVENYHKSPFSSAKLLFKASKKIEDLGYSNFNYIAGANEELIRDSVLLELSIKRYKEDPFFLIKKVSYNALMFWTLGDYNLKSTFIALLQIPLLFLFILSTVRIIKQKNILTMQGGIILLVWLYFIEYLPLLVLARYGVVLIPTMLTSLGILMPKLHEKK